MNDEIILMLNLRDGSILLNEGVLNALDWPRQVQLLVNIHERKLLLRACSVDDLQAVVIPEERTLSCEISTRSLQKNIKQLIGNILREENGNDFTYFLEYFLELLSHAVDERRYRQRQREEQAKHEEVRLARTALVTSAPPGDAVPVPPPERDLPTAEQDSPAPEQSGLSQDLSDFFDDAPMEETVAESEAKGSDDSVGRARLKDELYSSIQRNGVLTGPCAKLFLSNLRKGIETVTVDEIETACSVTREQAGNLITNFKKKGLIGSSQVYKNRLAVYQLNTKLPPLTVEDYTSEVITALQRLEDSEYALKKRRRNDTLLSAQGYPFGGRLRQCFQEGAPCGRYVTAKAYGACGKTER